MRILLSLLVLTFSLAIAPQVAEACSCMAPGTPAEELARASAVFEGTVTNIEEQTRGGLGLVEAPPPQMFLVTLSVTRTWKGVEGESVEVWTATNSAACGFTFEVGQAYLVYASSEGTTLSTGICSRTKSIGSAVDDLNALGGGVTPVTIVDPTPEPEEETGSETIAATAPPGASGCGSCAVNDSSAPTGLVWLVVVGAMLATRKR